MHHQTCPVFYVNDSLFSILINTDVDECTLGAADCHSTLATCINTEGSFKCECIDGYAGNGTTCQGKLGVIILSVTNAFLLINIPRMFRDNFWRKWDP